MTNISMLRLGIAFAGLLTLTSLAVWTPPNLAAVAQSSGGLTGAWRLVRTANPRGGPDAVSVMHTADPSRSDLDLAGLMIRCSQEGSELAIVLLNAFPLQTRPQVTFGKPGNETRFEATIGAPGTAVVLKGDPSRSDLDLAGLMIRCSQEGSELAIVLLNAFPLQTRPQVTFGKPGNETRFEATIGAPGTAVVLKGDPKGILGEAWSAEGDLLVRVTDGRKSVSGVVTLGGIQPAFALLKANCPTP